VNAFFLWPQVWPGAWKDDPHAAAHKLGQDVRFNFQGPSFPTNGAYQVKEFVRDNRIVLQPMKDYNGMSRGASVQNVIFAFYSSKPGMIAAAMNRETDVTQNYTAADIPQLKKGSNAFRLHVDPGFNFEHLEFNLDPTYHGKANPLADPNVRLALALSLDKVGLVRSALGLSPTQARDITAWTPLVNTSQLTQPFADTSIKGQWDSASKRFVATTGQGQALATARQLLARTPWKSGFTLDVATTSGNPVREAQMAVLMQNWARLGIKVNPVYIPASNLFAGWQQGGTLNHGDFQVAMFAFLGQPDPDQLKYNLESRYVDRQAAVHAEINQNYSGIHDSVIDRAFERAAHTINQAERARNYAAAQVELNKQAYWIPLYFRPAIATDSGRVANFLNNPTQTGPTWNMFAWKVKAAS
jgi:peptide/nickel transport system substrate-binding protein